MQHSCQGILLTAENIALSLTRVSHKKACSLSCTLLILVFELGLDCAKDIVRDQSAGLTYSSLVYNWEKLPFHLGGDNAEPY
jgi:hypothetical protein